MDENKLSFKCRACKKVHNISIKDKKGFEIVAFDNIIEWSDFNDEIPLLEERIWERSFKTPQKGELRIVQAHAHFNFSIGEEFCTVFYPALSSLNGWDEYPEEIDFSAVVKCRFENVITKNDEKAWITVRVEEVFCFSDICEKITIRKDLINVEYFESFRNYYSSNYQNWSLFNAGSEGDIGVWALVKKHKDQNIAVAYGEWDFNSDVVYFGNVLLSSYEMNYLLKLFNDRI